MTLDFLIKNCNVHESITPMQVDPTIQKVGKCGGGGGRVSTSKKEGGSSGSRWYSIPLLRATGET